MPGDKDNGLPVTLKVDINRLRIKDFLALEQFDEIDVDEASASEQLGMLSAMVGIMGRFVVDDKGNYVSAGRAQDELEELTLPQALQLIEEFGGAVESAVETVAPEA